jgi:hypothetical protein
MTELPPDIEQQLVGMSDAEFSALTAKVRAPDSTEAFRTVAAKHVSGDALDAVVHVADISKFTSENGTIDEAKVAQHLRVLFPQGAGQPPQYGQASSRTAPGLRPGDRGRTAAAQRFGKPLDPEAAAAAGQLERGAAGRAEATRRFPQQKDGNR